MIVSYRIIYLINKIILNKVHGDLDGSYDELIPFLQVSKVYDNEMIVCLITI